MTTASANAGVTAVVMAGQRPGGDALAIAHGETRKALVRVGGEAMLARVLDTLRAHDAMGPIVVVAQKPDALAAEPVLARFADDTRIRFAAAEASIAASLTQLIADGLDAALITTADNVLMTPAMIDAFLAQARSRDLAVAMVERRVLIAAYPQSRRSWLKFRGGAWSGANLFWIGGAQVMPLVEIWRGAEQERKKGRRVIAAFGPGLSIASLLRLITLPEAIRRVGRRHGIDATLVAMTEAEACIDVDKPADLALAETILAVRRRGRATPVRPSSRS